MQGDNAVASHRIGVIKHNRVVPLFCKGMAMHGETLIAHGDRGVVVGFV